MTPIVTPTEMAAIDAAAPEPVEELIERAGWAVHREALDLLGGTYGRRVVVIAGGGNNGADGRSAARLLERRGVRCTVIDAGSEAAAAGRRLPRADLIVDAAYGTGFHGTYHRPEPHDRSTPVLAVDIPSGIDGVTGRAAGIPWRATRTITFAALKPGLLLADGPDHAGEIRVTDIGLDTRGARAELVDPTDLGTLLDPGRWSEREVHKWDHAAWVVAGSPGMTGAAALTTAAAMRAGAGYVRLSVPGGEPGPDTPVEAVGFRLSGDRWADEIGDDLDRFGALTVGPGLGRDPGTDRQVRRLVERTTTPMLLDGDGIRAVGDVADLKRLLRRRPVGSVVLTPHDGEHRALTGSPPPDDRFEAVRRLATEAGAVILLKGPTTLVADPTGHVRAATAGDARLATAGTGDVLSGIVTGLLTRGIAPADAAAAASVLHGRAGDLAFPRGLVATDLVDHLPAVLQKALGG